MGEESHSMGAKEGAVKAHMKVIRVHEKMLLDATARTGHLRQRIQMVHRRDLT